MSCPLHERIIFLGFLTLFAALSDSVAMCQAPKANEDESLVVMDKVVPIPKVVISPLPKRLRALTLLISSIFFILVYYIKVLLWNNQLPIDIIKLFFKFK